jgi:hypothetical protein
MPVVRLSLYAAESQSFWDFYWSRRLRGMTEGVI